MFNIYKISNGSPIDYAAEELRKYLKMMMPDGGNFNVYYNETKTDGHRLGLMSDFGLDTSDAEDIELDDIIYIDTVGKSGIIAGSNPRGSFPAGIKKNAGRREIPPLCKTKK